MLYTHEEVEQLLAQRMAAVRAEVAATMKAPPPTPPPPAPLPPPAATRNPDDGWLLAVVLLIVLLGVLYAAIFMPVEWNEFRTRVILAYNELLLQLPR